MFTIDAVLHTLKPISYQHRLLIVACLTEEGSNTRSYRVATVGPGGLDTPPIVIAILNASPLTPTGVRMSARNTPVKSPGEAPAKSTIAGFPPIVAVTEFASGRSASGLTEPVELAGSVCPPPVP